MSSDRFGELVVNVTAKSDSSLYILELLDENGKVTQEKRYVGSGQQRFRFLKPGEVKLRVVEDMNRNGVWDPGNLIERLQPERVEVYMPDNGNDMMTMKANWEIEINVDMNDLFKPIDIYDIRKQIEQQEQLRYKRWLEEQEKKQAQRREQEMQNFRGGGQVQPVGTGAGGLQGVGNVLRQ